LHVRFSSSDDDHTVADIHEGRLRHGSELAEAVYGKKKMTTEDLVNLLEAVNGNIAIDECRVKLANGVVIMLEDKKKTP